MIFKPIQSDGLFTNIKTSFVLNWQINRSGVVTYLFMIVLQVVSSVLSLYLASRVIGLLATYASTKSINIDTLYLYAGLAGLALLVEQFAWRWISLTVRRMWANGYKHTSIEVPKAIAALDMEQHHDNDLQKMLNKITDGYNYIPQNYMSFTLELVHSVARLFSTLFIVLSFAPLLIPIMIISLLPGLITERKFSKLQWNLWRSGDGDKMRLAWLTSQSLMTKHKLQEVKVFGTKQHLVTLLDGLFGNFRNKQMKNIDSIRLPAIASLFSQGVVIIGVNIWLIQKVIYQGFSIASFSFYSGVISQFASSLGLIVNSFAQLINDNEYMKDYFDVLNMKPAMAVPANPQLVSDKQIPIIAFNNVSFKYPGTKTWSLRHINLTIKPTDKVAFVGENGAGKTTLIKLLLRYYDATEGSITVNGIDIRQIELTSYYHHIGVLFQNFNDYPYSVRDNIALGRVEAFDDDDRAFDAARQADAHKFIKKYPKTYDQILDIGFKEGIEPSGGQWQRLGLARALFRDAGILILDEPTAAVDAKSEYAIFQTLDKHSKHKTTIIISHRFSTVRKAEHIYVIQNGSITENGSHNQLMKIKNGHYKELFDKQAEGYR